MAMGVGRFVSHCQKHSSMWSTASPKDGASGVTCDSPGNVPFILMCSSVPVRCVYIQSLCDMRSILGKV
jgi:hypothetical protein